VVSTSRSSYVYANTDPIVIRMGNGPGETSPEVECRVLECPDIAFVSKKASVWDGAGAAAAGAISGNPSTTLLDPNEPVAYCTVVACYQQSDSDKIIKIICDRNGNWVRPPPDVITTDASGNESFNPASNQLVVGTCCMNDAVPLVPPTNFTFIPPQCGPDGFPPGE